MFFCSLQYMKWRLLTIPLLLYTSLAHSQQTAPERALKLKDSAVYYESIDTAVSARYYNQAITYAQKNKLDYETGVIYHNMSFLHTASSRYTRSIQVLDSALLFLNRSDSPQRFLTIAKVHQALANNYRYSNETKEAVKYTLQAIGEFEQLKNYPAVVKTYFNLSLLYKEMNEFTRQLESGRKALQAAERLGNADDRFLAYSTIANAYTNLGDYRSAASARDSALIYSKGLNNVPALISFHLVSGLINMNLGELGKARVDFTSSLSLAEGGKQVFSITQSKMQLARVLTMQKNYKEAESILHSLDTAIAKSNEKAQRVILLDYFARLYEEQGRYKDALDYYRQYLTLKDSLTTLENRKYITELETRYETGKKEAQIDRLELEGKVHQLTIRQKSYLIYILGGFAALLLVLFGLAYNNHRQKQRLQRQRIAELETEKQLMATEAILKGEALERTRLAKDLHDGLGGMLSGIKYSLDTMKRNLVMTPENQQAFERSIDMLDSSIQEMRRVAHNMMPESLVNFGIDAALKDFCNDMSRTGAIAVSYQSIGLQGQTIDQTTAITIYRIVQELINNIIKHAAAKNAIVQVSKKDRHLSITVEDDGIGFDAGTLASPATAPGGKGMGWSNVQHRVELLKGKLDVKSLPGNGTSVLIEFNI